MTSGMPGMRCRNCGATYGRCDVAAVPGVVDDVRAADGVDEEPPPHAPSARAAASTAPPRTRRCQDTRSHTPRSTSGHLGRYVARPDDRLTASEAQTTNGRAVGGIGLGRLVAPVRYSSPAAAAARPSAIAQTISDWPRPASPAPKTPSTLEAYDASRATLPPASGPAP